MKRLLSLYLLGLRNALAARMTYRADFFVSSVIVLLGDLVIPLISVLIYVSGATFTGWSLPEVLLVQGIFMSSRGIANTFFNGAIWNTLDTVREGTYDLILLRPVPSLHLTMATAVSCDDLGVVLGGIAMVVYGLANVGWPSAIRVAAFLLFFAFSLIVLLSFAVIMAATVFRWVGNSRVYEIADSVTMFGQYPATIYSRVIATLVTWAVPVAMIGFIPASVLLDRPVAGIIPAIVSSLLLLALSLLIWRRMSGRYASAGG